MANNQFCRDATGRLTYSMSQTRADSYRPMCAAIAAAFALTPHAELVTNGFDVAFEDYQRDGLAVGLEWDNWMGYTVVAKTPASEDLVQEIAAWLANSAWATKG